jgi:hypothetical protein
MNSGDKLLQRTYDGIIVDLFGTLIDYLPEMGWVGY